MPTRSNVSGWDPFSILSCMLHDHDQQIYFFWQILDILPLTYQLLLSRRSRCCHGPHCLFCKHSFLPTAALLLTQLAGVFHRLHVRHKLTVACFPSCSLQHVYLSVANLSNANVQQVQQHLISTRREPGYCIVECAPPQSEFQEFLKLVLRHDLSFVPSSFFFTSLGHLCLIFLRNRSFELYIASLAFVV